MLREKVTSIVKTFLLKKKFFTLLISLMILISLLGFVYPKNNVAKVIQLKSNILTKTYSKEKEVIVKDGKVLLQQESEFLFNTNIDFSLNKKNIISSRLNTNSFFDINLVESHLIKSNLQEQGNLNTFYLFSHGRSGALFVNNEWYNALQIIDWLKQTNLLKGEKYLNIYGCNFAKGEKGRKAVQLIEKQLGIQVAASDDITGKDGDWELEIGRTNTSLIIKNYQYNLQGCCNNTHSNGAGGHNHVKSLTLKYTGPSGNVNLYTDDNSGGTGTTNITQFVQTGSTVIFAAAGSQKFGSNSDWTYPGGTIDLHTSCSQNDVILGATFGPFEILGIVTANGCSEGQQTTCQDVGTNGNLSICPSESVTAAMLFSALGGSPDTGGTWTPTPNGLGTYTYTHTNNPGTCPSGSSQVIVSNNTNGTDTDNDGIIDDCDLDDDNDGILDINEGLCVSSSNTTINLHPYSGQSPSESVFNNNTIGFGNSQMTVSHTTTGNASITTNEISNTHAASFPGIRMGHSGSSNSANSIANKIITTINYSALVTNFSFRLYDIDAGDRIIVKAYDQNNNLININSSNYTLFSNTVITYGGNNTFLDNSNSDYGTDDQRTRIDINYNNSFISSVVLEYYDINPGGSYTSTAFSGTSCGGASDTDNDGIPNYLDSDSDNDGCSDAIEGGANFTNSNIDANERLTGGIDANGVPTIATANGQTVGNSQNNNVRDAACVNVDCIPSATNPDTDNDGLADICDLDDDNDGITDIEEGCNEVELSSNTFNAKLQAWQPAGIALVNGQDYQFNLQNSSLGIGMNGSGEQFHLISYSENQGMYSDYDGRRHEDVGNPNASTLNGNSTTVFPTDGFISAGPANMPFANLSASDYSTLLTFVGMIDVNNNGQYDQAAGDILIDNIFSNANGLIGGGTFTASVSGDLYLVYTDNDYTDNAGDISFTVTIGNCIDTDGDGIVNSLDPDSDNDGCPDAIEGGANFTYSNTNVDNRLTGNVDADGIPIIATSSGQTVGSSQNNSVQDANCANPCDPATSGNIDTDNDGIADVCDLDDDNDGILDEDECDQISESFKNTALSGFEDEYGNFDEATGTVSGFKYPSSPNSENGTINYEQLRAARVIGGTFLANFFGNNDSRGKVTINTIAADVSTISNIPITNTEINFEDLDGAPTIFHLELFSKTGKITNISDIDASLYDGNGTATLSIVDLGSGIFEFTVAAPSSGHNTNLRIRTPNRVISNIVFDLKQSIGFTNEVITFPFTRRLLSCQDTDNDGTPDYQDLDSDGDNCPDAIEGDGTFTTANIDGNNRLTGNIDVNGVPSTATSSGQSIGSSQDETVQDADCPDPCSSNTFSDVDSDGDGIADICDLDDDNDGITDINEGCNDGIINFPNAEKGYLFQDDPTQVYTVDLQTGATNLITTLGYLFNAVAINEADGLFWGMDRSGTFDQLVTLDPNTFSVVNNFGGSYPKSTAGVYDPILKRYIATGTSNIIFVIDADPNSGTYGSTLYQFNITSTVADLLYNSDNGLLYGINTSTNDLYEFDAVNQTETLLGPVSGLPAATYGACYSTFDGRMFFGNNSNGIIYLVDIINLTASVFTNGPVSSRNDGAKVLGVALNGNQLCLDTDKDGIVNSLDPDSDNDGCFDVVESSGIDANNDGILDGTSVNGNGLVMGGVGGYNGTNGSEIIATQVTVTTTPSNQIVVGGGTVFFEVSATADNSTDYNNGIPIYGTSGNGNAGLRYQWYVENPNNGGIALTDNTIFSGTNTATLNINNTEGYNGYEFCVVVTHQNSSCVEQISCGSLTLTENCSNAVDDDGDGLIDCDDSDCIPSAPGTIIRD